MKNHVDLIMTELSDVFEHTDFTESDSLIHEITKAESVVCVGAGRVGLCMSAFAKRLMHLGKRSYWIEDVTLPELGQGALVLMASGSGETETMRTYARLAKKNGYRLALISATESSTILQLSDIGFRISAPNKNQGSQSKHSSQPMTSLFEQSLYLFLDALVLELMKEMSVSSDLMGTRHNLLE